MGLTSEVNCPIRVLFRKAFGSQEGIPREPSPGEIRLMTYAALIAGATGTFAFAKEDADVGPPAVYNYVHVGTAQPRSASLWSEARRLALEVRCSRRLGVAPRISRHSDHSLCSSWRNAGSRCHVPAKKTGRSFPASSLGGGGH